MVLKGNKDIWAVINTKVCVRNVKLINLLLFILFKLVPFSRCQLENREQICPVQSNSWFPNTTQLIHICP